MIDGWQRYHAAQALAPHDLPARANVAARLAHEPAQIDVRVRQPSAVPWPPLGNASVSMRDMLGASIVTYDQHLDSWPRSEDSIQPLESKAVYVQYKSQDPVTGEFAPVVVPAAMSLDVYADPNWLGPPVEEERVVEEEKDDNEEEDRQKLRSSIKGDPILLRAKPAPPPDSYFPPQAPEIVLPKLSGMGAWGPLFAASSGGIAGSMFAGSPTASNVAERSQGGSGMKHVDVSSTMRPSSQMATRTVAAQGTMSSFLKSSGKDKYSKSRLNELDQILKSTESRDADPLSPARPASNQYNRVQEGWSSPRSRPGTRGGGPPPMRGNPGSGSSPRSDAESGALAAQMAMYIQRMPQFHKGKLARKSPAEAANIETYASEAMSDGNGLIMGGSSGTGLGLEDGEAPEGGRRSPGSQTAVTEKAPHATLGRSLTGSTMGQRSEQSVKPGDARAPGSARTMKQKLRDLDPHIDISESIPTQRLHSNWPDGQRRQLARNFYGLSPAQILEEEEKERLREQGAVQRKKDPTVEEGDAAVDKDATGEHAGETRTEEAASEEIRKARREAERRVKNLERTLARGSDGGLMFHRLEVRIRNISRPERVVVGRPTERMDGDNSKFRKCVLLDSLKASRMGLSGK